MSEQPEAGRVPGRVECLELSFDLVVVAAVAVLSETLCCAALLALRTREAGTA